MATGGLTGEGDVPTWKLLPSSPSQNPEFPPQKPYLGFQKDGPPLPGPGGTRLGEGGRNVAAGGLLLSFVPLFAALEMSWCPGACRVYT